MTEQNSKPTIDREAWREDATPPITGEDARILALLNALDEAEDKVRGHESMKWPEEAHRLQQQRNEGGAK